MEENNNEPKINAEEIKQEATDTVNQVKDTIKNSDLKKDTNEAKGFFSNFFKNPIQTIEDVANSSKNTFLKIAIIILVIWVVATFLGSLISVFKSYSYMSSYYYDFGTFLKNSVSNIFSVVKDVVAPVISVALISLIVYLMQKNEKKSFITIASSVLVAEIPVVIASVVSLLKVFSSQVSRLTAPFSAFCGILSTILLFFTIKSLYKQEDNNSFIKKFAIIMGIFYVAYFVISFFGIYISL